VKSYSPETRLNDNSPVKFRIPTSLSKNSQSIDSLNNAYCKQDANTLTLMKISKAVKHDYIPR